MWSKEHSKGLLQARFRKGEVTLITSGLGGGAGGCLYGIHVGRRMRRRGSIQVAGKVEASMGTQADVGSTRLTHVDLLGSSYGVYRIDWYTATRVGHNLGDCGTRHSSGSTPRCSYRTLVGLARQKRIEQKGDGLRAYHRDTGRQSSCEGW